MSARYWIAKYVEDPFRNEPRNVGVIVFLNEIAVGRFVGERENGSLDARKLKGFSRPSVYTQWRTYWHRKIRAKDMEALTSSSTANYAVTYGGEVTDTGDDNATTVCRFLYDLLVGGGPLAAFEWDDEEAGVGLAEEIIQELDRTAILAKAGQLFARHPVQRNANIIGKSVVHTPSFSQRNGHLTVMEYIDLGVGQINKTKERAGWMAYMFRDIKDLEQDSDAVSLIRPKGDNRSEQIEYARKVLSNGSRIVNWLDDNERSAFMTERRMIAEPGFGLQ